MILNSRQKFTINHRYYYEGLSKNRIVFQRDLRQQKTQSSSVLTDLPIYAHESPRASPGRTRELRVT